MDMMGLVWDIQGLGPDGVLYFFIFFISPLFLFHLLSVYNISFFLPLFIPQDIRAAP